MLVVLLNVSFVLGLCFWVWDIGFGIRSSFGFGVLVLFWDLGFCFGDIDAGFWIRDFGC